MKSRILTAGMTAAFLVMGAVPAYAEIPYPNVVAEPGTLQGWQKSGQHYWYFDQAGNQIVNGFSADGYYLDFNGRWKKKTLDILEASFETTDFYRSPASYGGFVESFLVDLDHLNTQVQNYLGNTRLFRMDNNSVSYYRRGTDNKETFLLGMFRDQGSDRWRIRVATNLGDLKGDQFKASTYDYMVLTYFLSRFSHEPEYLGEAIHSNWQGNNHYEIREDRDTRIADVKVRVQAVDGAADYYIGDGRQ